VRGESRGGSVDEHPSRSIRHRAANGSMTAGGGEPSSHQHDLALGEPLDLVQDV
jgi:hypothetical protein